MENGHDTQEFRVEKGVPRPKGYGSGNRRGKYPWAQMEIGDSFAVPRSEEEHQLNYISRAASLWGKRNARKFSLRSLTENGQRVIRIWWVE